MAQLSDKAAKQRVESLGFLGIAAAGLVLLNVLGVFLFFRADATANRAYTLSNGSRRSVRELDETLTITAYFSEDLPPPFNTTERYVRDILAEYQAAGRGHVEVRFVSPDSDEEREEATSRGVQLVQHQNIENNAVSVVEGFRGIVFEYLGERQAIPVVQPDTAGLEYDVTMAIKRVSTRSEDRPVVGLLSGHEGPTTAEGLSTLARMLPHYQLREVSANEEIDRNVRALLIVEPKTEITDTELRRINQFVMRGGSLGVFGGSMTVDLQQPETLSARATGSNLNTLLRPWGLTLGENIVADARCSQVPMQHPMGMQIPVPFPPAPVVVFEGEQASHPVLFRLSSTTLFFASAIETTDAFRQHGGRVLMRSTGEQNSWLLTGAPVDVHIRDPREWRSTMGGQSGPFVLSAALEGRLPSAYSDAANGIEAPAQSETSDTEDDDSVRVLVVGSAWPIRDELYRGARMSDSDLAGAMALGLNAVDWLAGDSDLIAVRAKSVEEPALAVPQSIQTATQEALETAQTGDQQATEEALERREAALAAENRKKLWYQALNMLGVPLAIALFGIVRWQMRKARRASLKA